ncbi:SDR family NAD(P)-dependent oxidoreductase, partial [Paenibacillus sp. TAF58]
MTLFNLSGKTAFVTGASGGLGQAMAIGLAEAGANVIAVSSSESVQTVEAIRALGGKAELIAADLSNEDILEDVVNNAIGIYGS